MANTEAGGLFVKDSDARVPLTGVQIDVTGSGAAAKVTVRQRYVNQEKKPIEAVYSFPLEEGSAVCELIVETGGRRLVGKIEEREKAFEQYDDAMAAGNGAFLADQDRPNIFTMSAGNLLPGQEATISLTYATELEQHGDSVRLMLPTTISPRYVPAQMEKTADPAELERINPPTLLGSVPYGLQLKVEYTAPHGVKSVSCPSHPAQVEVDGNIARVELMGQNVQLDRDFVLNLTLQKAFEPGAVVARDGGSDRAVMINLFPDLKQFRREPGEFIFVIDRSGSMQGDSIAQALNAVQIALRSMDEGDRFNVVGFGSSFELLFPEPRLYNQEALDSATKLLKAWTADLGGTELLAPLTAVLEAKRGEQPRQIMILTDGQVGNEADCIAKAAKHAGDARIFTFGIGHGASEHLVNGLARAGGGKAEFIQPNERIEPKVMRQFARAAAPFLKNVRMDWGGLKTDLFTPHQIPTLFDGDRLTVYARVTGAADTAAAEVAIVADGPKGALRFPVKVDLERPTGLAAVPVLMARNAIRELEEGRGDIGMGSNQKGRKKKSVEEKVLEIALRYQIMSSQTSFVAVEERVAGTQTERAELRRVPVALTKGWGGVDGAVPGGAPSAGFGGAAAGTGMFAPVGSAAFAASMPTPPPAPAMAAPHKPKPASRMRAQEPNEQSKKRSGGSLLSKMKEAVFGGGKPATPTASQDSARFDDMAIIDNLDHSQVDAEMESPGRIGEVFEPVDLFMLLTQSQRADGSFKLDNEILQALGVAGAQVGAAMHLLGDGAAAKAVVHTALTLLAFTTRFPSRRDEWRLMADKAERWLAKQPLALPAGAKDWTTWAGKQMGL